MNSQKIKVIGMMSGTSIDGLDIAYCEFWQEKKIWHFELIKSGSYAYETELHQILQRVTELSALDLILLDRRLGWWFGEKVKDFIDTNDLEPELIASHGHTVFHQPEKGLTFQIGSGLNMMLSTGVTVINDFRIQDLAIGGQGAPLVPIGDKLLFHEYDACLNLGGFANISADAGNPKQRIAYDICAVNTVMNYLAGKVGQPYDAGGQMAAQGQLVNEWLNELNQIQFYQQPYPKSLGIEWVNETIIPSLEQKYLTTYSIPDLLQTYVQHISGLLSSEIKNIFTEEGIQNPKILVTGGGAFNEYLIKTTRTKLGDRYHLVVPEKSLIENKEAIVFALLGLLKLKGEVNILSSVTGASHDHSAGVIYHPN